METSLLQAHGVRCEAGVVTGTIDAGGSQPLTLVWESLVVGAGVVRADGGFRLGLPAFAVQGRVDVLATATGQSVLQSVIVLGTVSSINWLAWSGGQGRVEGQFTVRMAAGAERPAALVVEATGDAEVMAQGLAVPDAEGVYRFSAPLRRLIGMGARVVLRPLVAGMAVDAMLELGEEATGVLGHVDTIDGRFLRGWAVDLGERSRRVAIELRAEGRTIGTAVARETREDLRALGISDGQSGFAVPLPAGLDRSRDWTLHAYLAGTQAELVGSPLVLAKLPPVIGYFDAVEGPFAGGWAVNMVDPLSPLALEAVCEGEVIGSGVANLYRGDVEAAGLPTAWCGFRFLLERPLRSLFDKDISLRVAGSGAAIGGSPRQISQNTNIVRFLTRAESIAPAVRQRLIRRMTRETAGVPISIVMPVYNTPAEWLIEALNSVLGQWSGNWELICVDDASPAPHVGEILYAAERHDPRIQVIRLSRNGGIAAATNAGIAAAQGAFVTFMDHDDVIEPDAVHKLARAATETGADLIYSDEAITTDDIDSIVEVRARPAFSHDYYLSHPYFVHMVCVRTALARRLNGWDEALPISADVDFVLRAIEAAERVAHVPSVLYRWRTHGGSAGHAKMEQVTSVTTELLQRHLTRLGQVATVEPGFRYNEYKVNWPDDGGEVLIVIPTKNRVDLLRPCIESIERTAVGALIRIVVIDHESTDPATTEYLRAIGARHTVMPYSGVFNYALMNNLAVATHGGGARHLLFLNNDVEAFEEGWIQRMRSLSGRPDVGAVGPLLLYGDKRVQHAGVLMGFAGAADHAMKFHAAYLGEGQRHPGYNCCLTSVRDYSAVTAACVMMRHDVFRQVGGFDESFVVGFNDTDLCLRIVQAGYKVLYDGVTVLFHHESATRTESKSVHHPEDDARLRARWSKYLTEGDPFYSPLLSPRGTDHTLRQDAGCKGRMAPRVVVQRLTPAAAGPSPARAPAPRVAGRAAARVAGRKQAVK